MNRNRRNRRLGYLNIVACLLLFIAVVCLVGGVAYAQAIYDRSTAAIAVDGAGEWVNTREYAHIALKRIWIIDNAAAADTQTITRVTADGIYTQAVGSITIASNAGNTSSLTAAYMKYGDKLVFAGTGATNATVMIEYEVQTR